MTKKVGRKSKYQVIKYNFEYIDKQLNNGASEKQVAEALGIAYSTWNKYKDEYKEFKALCNKSRVNLVENLRSALVKKAIGFTYEEKKTYIKRDSEGNEYKYTEVTTKQSLPDTTAIFGALNIYDEDYVKDRKAHELREREVKLKEAEAEKNNW